MRKLLLAATVTLIAIVSGVLGASAAEQVAAAVATPTGTAQAQMTAEDKADYEVGKSAAESFEKQPDVKVLKDSPALPRLNAVVERIRPVTQKPYLTYTVKVIDVKAINAFSLPGGFIYFTQGLLDAVESDDELAAVAGHEMAHVALSHSRRMMSRSERYNKILGPLVLASILSRSDRIDPGAMLMVGSMVVEDALNHYGREAELEADREAVVYLRGTKTYNPVAMLTVSEGLAHMESGEPKVEWGISQTHPYAQERVAALLTELTQLGIPLERRRVTKSLVTSAAAAKVGDAEIGELRISASGGMKPWSSVVFQPAVEVGGVSPIARAQRASEAANSLLLANLGSLEVRSSAADSGIVIMGRDTPLFTITPGDAAFHKTTVEKLTSQAMQAIRTGFQQEKVGRAF